jgi:hypothetical protein
VAVVAASAVPIVAFGVFNRTLGGGWLPNSLLAKGNSGGTSRDGLTPTDIVGRAASDPLLLVLLAAALAYLVMRGRRGAAFVPAVTLVIATAIHVVLADVGWYDRYQAYLIAIGVYAVLAFLAELPESVARRGLVALCVVTVVAAVPKFQLTVMAPLAADDMYRQQYQAGRFLERYYDGVPVATDQLGYISLFHDGPLTDFAGLGDWEVLERRAEGGEPKAELWRDIAAERGVEVMVTYDVSAFGAPREWIRVGTWQIDDEPTTGVSRKLVFFATGPDRVAPLEAALLDFEDDMPARSELILNENAGLQAMALEAEAARADAAEPAP